MCTKFAFVLSALLAGPAYSHEAELKAVEAQYRSATLDEATGSPRRTIDWQFDRTGNVVSIAAPAEQRSEQWVRDNEGRVWYTRIFHREKKIVEYEPVDLKLSGLDDSWGRIESLIDSKVLAALQRADTKTEYFGHQATLYRGKLNDVEITVYWLDELAVPAFLEERTLKGRSTLELRGISDVVEGSSATRPAALEGYERIDFSDLGDREGDPFVESLMKYDGLWMGHGH